MARRRFGTAGVIGAGVYVAESALPGAGVVSPAPSNVNHIACLTCVTRCSLRSWQRALRLQSF
jgi:hypothetical protein